MTTQIVAALDQPQNPKAVKNTVSVIWDHCQFPNSVNAAANREAYATAGAIPALVVAGTTHLHQTDVVVIVLQTFVNLMDHNDTNWVF